ncbi:Mitochondrial chaperone BCS1-like protein [Hibiscus syriacus]|uniref:Mitochondrial chaperone BCS1-like protein n=1 Tax=Hibiscus syriacus TaxID=106335 RepID=A0A6A2ZT78_HIBSY|nr:Mitochondrial chaperone BCS1-like protein [Hibiscus syriacus]
MLDGKEPSLRSRLSVSQHQDQPQDAAAYGQKPHSGEKSFFELIFKKKHKDKVLDFYLLYVLLKAEETKNKDKAIKLYSRQCPFIAVGDLKKMIIDDLDSLVAAMANYLKFDIYDLGLTSVRSDADLRRTLLSTAVEDERIIVFTTNYKDQIHPALLRPGRMDLHINMSYCTGYGFRILASNYLGIYRKYNPFFGEIDGLLKSMEASPTEVAEELMRSDDADTALQGLLSSSNGREMKSMAQRIKQQIVMKLVIERNYEGE